MMMNVRDARILILIFCDDTLYYKHHAMGFRDAS